MTTLKKCYKLTKTVSAGVLSCPGHICEMVGSEVAVQPSVNKD